MTRWPRRAVLTPCLGPGASGPPLDGATDRWRLDRVGFATVQHRIESAAQEGGVLRGVFVVGVRGAAVAEHSAGIEHENIRRRLRAIGAGDALRLVVQVRDSFELSHT